MSYETVTERIKLILSTVEGVYNIHTYLRDIEDEKKFEQAFKIETPQGPLLACWLMTRKAVPTTRPSVDANALLDITHSIEIQGMYSLQDEKQSELDFQKIIDNVLQRFKTKFLLEDDSGVALTGIIRTSELSIPEIGYGQFGNMFVHFCRMVISVEERL